MRTPASLTALFFVFTFAAPVSAATILLCEFEKLPKMKLVLKGGMGAEDNTLQVGKQKPVKLNVGSSLMIATVGAQELVFSLRLPTSVTISAPDNDSLTYYGECNAK